MFQRLQATPKAFLNRQNQQRRASRRALQRVRPLHVEELELRWLLAGVPIPFTINPTSAPQTLFAADSTQWTLQNPATGAQLYRFAVDGPSYSGQATFHLVPAVPPPVADAAIALFDGSGNRIASVDADSIPGQPGEESLTVELVSGQVYILGLFFPTASPPSSFNLNVHPGLQVINTPLAINPIDGTTTFVANSGEDALTDPRDVDYYPLDLTNGGPTGNVAITPLGLNGEIFASVYRRDASSDPWKLVGSGSNGQGGTVNIALAAVAGRNLTDSAFMLSLSTENFDGGPGGYQIQVAAGSVLAPTTITPATATDFFTPKPISPGTLGADNTATLPVGQAKLYRFRAAETGTASLKVTSSANTVVSVYDEAGTTLLDVFTGQPGSPAAKEVSVVEGMAYHVRVEPKTLLTPETFTLSLRSSYTPQPVNISLGPATTVANVGAGQVATSLRVTPVANAEVLVVQVEVNSPAELDVAIVGAGDGDLSPFKLTTTVVAGSPLVWPVDIAGQVGPFDIFVQGTTTPASATIKLGALDLPTTIIKDAVPNEALSTLGVLNASRTTSGFGDITGAQFVELQRDTTLGTGATLTADGQTGARLPSGPVPVLAHYRQVGSTLRLQSYEIADETNKAQIEYTQNLGAQTFHALIGFNSSFTGAGQVEFNLAGEAPLFVGIQMVPDLSDPQPPPHRFIFAARNVQLASEFDRDLWKTILPFNILTTGSYPVLTFRPSESSMQVRVTATLDPAGPSLASKTMTQQDSTWVLNAVPPGNDAFFFKNRSLYFVVEPIAGQLGNGIYTLDMKVNTTDPNPYLAYEQAFVFPNLLPLPNDLPTNVPGEPNRWSFLPPEFTGTGSPLFSPAIVDLVQDPTGFGSAVGTFDSAQPFSSGAIDVYRFWVATPGPVTVRTIGLPNLDGEVVINTNFNLYREYFAPNNVLYLRDFDGAVSPGLGDWFPADREFIDDQTRVNYFDPIAYSQTVPGAANNFYLTKGGAYYVVVKNEQGTVGDYTIEVDTQPFPLLGNAATYDLARKGDVVQLPWNGTTNTQATFSLPYIQGVDRFVGYVPLQLPVFHNGTLQIVGQANSGWNLHLFDENFVELPGSVDPTVGSPSHTEGTFTVPLGTQRLYLRVHEFGENLNGWASLTASIGLVQPFGIAAPPTIMSPTPAARIMTTTPAGDTPTVGGVLQPFTDAMTLSNQTKRYAFQSQGGHVSVQVAPESNAGVPDVGLAWGVYVDGQLMTWNHTYSPPTGGSEVQFFLPDIRPPIDPTDYEYDRGPYYDVVVHVQTVSSPINGGDFSVVVNTSSDLPMRNGDLVLPPLNLFSSTFGIKDGNDWTHFVVPSGASAVTLEVRLSGRFRYGPPVRLRSL